MLLPSALPCDVLSKGSKGMVSPPASPPSLSSTASFSIVSSCFSLQNLIANATPEQHHHHHHHQQQQQQQQQHVGDIGSLPRPLPTPPMLHAPSPMKLRLRARGTVAQEEARGIVKRSIVPRHKRAHSSTSQNASSSSSSSSSTSDADRAPEPPTTPKRSRIAPERMPLGLERADFHGLPTDNADPEPSTGDEWSAEDDRMLVELVLEKLKLSKSDWQDCARSLGKDRHNLSRRWKSLILNDEVGLKRRKIHSTWR